MGFMLSPGVQVREFDLTGIVPAVATTEGALAGDFRWGPIYERILVDSESELIRVFQRPNSRVANDWFTASNFLNYGNRLWVVRIANETSNEESDLAKNATSSNTDGFLIKNRDDYDNNFSDGSLNTSHGTGEWVARYAGELGNSLKVSVCPSAEAFQSTLTGTLTVLANTTTVTGNGTNFQLELVEGDLIEINNETNKVVEIANATSFELQNRHLAGAEANTAIRRWEYFNSFDQPPGTSDFAALHGTEDDEMHVAIVDEDGEWERQRNIVLEVYQNVSKASDALRDDGSTNYYKEVINQRSRFVYWAGHDITINDAGAPAKGADFTSSAIPLNYSLVGGNDGVVGTAEKLKGYNLFQSSEDVDISLVLGSDANQTIAVHIINNICEHRKDCVAFLSPPRLTVVNNEGNEHVDAVNFRNLLPSTSYAALDSGWKFQYDRHNDVYRHVPMNGDVAGLHVRTDAERDPWWAAAGLNRGNIKNVIKLSWNPRQAHRDTLYKNGINPVVTFRGEGTVLFGQKTLLAKPSAFDRINVRRLFIVLEKAIAVAARFLLFEFNDEFTRAQFRNMVEPFLRDVQGRRGIFDFLVVCDDTNNTPEVIDRNEFVGDIYIKPARVAEFIRLNFIAVRTGVEFNEIVGRFGG